MTSRIPKLSFALLPHEFVSPAIWNSILSLILAFGPPSEGYVHSAWTGEVREDSNRHS